MHTLHLHQWLLLLLLIGIVDGLYGQLMIESGVQFIADGKTNVIVQDLDWQQNGVFKYGQSNVIMRGIAPSTITGATPQFYCLTIDKPQTAIRLQTPVVLVTKIVRFDSGGLDLRGDTLDLGMTGTLLGETESNRAFSSQKGGIIHRQAILNAPIEADSGALGVAITSNQNLGMTTIMRGHDPQNLVQGPGIRRFYDIQPTTNSGLDATLEFGYFDAELNGRNEALLDLYSSNNHLVGWTLRGKTTLDTVLNRISLDQVDRLRYWTAATVEIVSSTDPSSVAWGVNLYPNPADKQAWLAITGAQVDLVTVQLLDMRGKLVWEAVKMINDAHTVIPLELEMLTEGIYTLLVAQQGHSQTVRMMIK